MARNDGSGDERDVPLSRRRLLAAAGSATLGGVAGCLQTGGEAVDTEDPLATGTAPPTRASPTTSGESPTTSTPTEGATETPTEYPTLRQSTEPSTGGDCTTGESAPFWLSVSFDPTIQSVDPEELSFCVKSVRWVRAGENQDPIEYLAPADEHDDCFDLAPGEVSRDVWDRWGISPCTYETLGLQIATSLESFQFSDGHADHDSHLRGVEGGLVEWDLGEPVDVATEDELDITAHLDVAPSDGPQEYELRPGGITGL